MLGNREFFEPHGRSHYEMQKGVRLEKLGDRLRVKRRERKLESLSMKLDSNRVDITLVPFDKST
jgi:hypothetical protein